MTPSDPRQLDPRQAEPPSRPRPLQATPLPDSADTVPLPGTDGLRREPNPFTERDWRMLSYAWLGLIIRVSLVVGGLFSIYQYMENARDKRVTETLALVELWQQPEYQQAQIAVRRRIADLNAKYRSLLGEKPSATELGVFMDRVGLEALRNDESGDEAFKEQYDRVTYFLNRVATCVQAGRCERGLTDDYFRDLSVSFWNYFAGYAHRLRREGSTTYCVPLEEYVTGKRPGIANSIAATRR